MNDYMKDYLIPNKMYDSNVKEMLAKRDYSIWVEMNRKYSINKLNSSLTIIFIKMEHTLENKALTFSCIDSNKAFYSTETFQDFGQFSFRLHRHDFYEVMLVLEGELEVLIESKRYIYRRGDLCLINCNIYHKENYSKDFHAAYICLTKEYLHTWNAGEIYKLGNGRIACFFKDNLKGKTQNKKNYLDFFYLGDRSSDNIIQVESELIDISNELMGHRPGYQSIIKGMITRLFYILQDSKIYSSKYIKLDSSAEGNLFEEAIRYIEDKQGRVTRNELSNVLHYNGDYINQIFMKHTGQSLHEYSLSVCLSEAQYLLLNTSLSVSQIIKSLGFENRTNFYRQFSRRFGLTPMQYRVKNTGNKD